MIPSPFLTGAIPLFGRDGRFLYDVGLLETNRGCPYDCAFCYWGGAIGQKVYSFSRERLREELAFFGRAAQVIENICLCDANFGMLRSDKEFAEDLVATRNELGYPRNLATSWAKNKNKMFHDIVELLQETGFHSDFTLSLQSLSPEALEGMHRKNMKINDFEGLAAWLRERGMSAHCELIWGVPGETCESFIAGYDRLSKHIARIATYPLCILPNTDYAKERAKHQFITVRDTASDYEFILSNSTISVKDNRRMHHFLFWARVIAEYQILRHVWAPLRELAGVLQSEVMYSLDRWFAGRTDAASAGLCAYLRAVVDNFDITRVSAAALYVHTNEEALGAGLRELEEEEIVLRTPEHLRGFPFATSSSTTGPLAPSSTRSPATPTSRRSRSRALTTTCGRR